MEVELRAFPGGKAKISIFGGETVDDIINILRNTIEIYDHGNRRINVSGVNASPETELSDGDSIIVQKFFGDGMPAKFVIQNEATGNFVDFDSRRGDGGIIEDKNVTDTMKYGSKFQAEEDVEILHQICFPEKYTVVEVA